MSCPNNASTIIIRLDKDERFVSFVYSIVCPGNVRGTDAVLDRGVAAATGHEQAAPARASLDQRSFCGQVVNEKSPYSEFCQGKTPAEIIGIDFQTVLKNIAAANEEDRFFLFIEWDALRSALGQYLGLEDGDIDVSRCQTVAVKHDDEGIEITQFILPPSRLPNEKDRNAILGSSGHLKSGGEAK